MIEIPLRDLQFVHPFTMVVSGATGSGKTMLIRDYLADFETLIDGHGVNEGENLKVLWCHGVTQDLYRIKIANNIDVTYMEGLPTLSEIDMMSPRVIVVDDLMNELKNSTMLENLFTKYSHHHNQSVIFTLQNLYIKGSARITISRNANYMSLMKNARDAFQLSQLGREMDPNNPKRLLEAFDDATRKPYGYLVLDFKPHTADAHRIRTRVTSREVEHLGVNFAPIVYFPRY